MAEDTDDDDGAGLFEVEDVPPPRGGTNVAALDKAIKAARTSGRLADEDEALLQAARTCAVAMDKALRGKSPAYAVAACLRPYQDVLERLGLNGRAELPPAPAGGDATTLLLEALGRGPAPA